MKKARSKSTLQDKITHGALATLATIVVSGVAYGGWNWVRDIPSRSEVRLVAAQAKHSVEVVTEEVQFVGTKADYVMSVQMQSLIAQIARLESKQNKSRDDIEQLKYLREELERMRQVQRGK